MFIKIISYLTIKIIALSKRNLLTIVFFLIFLIYGLINNLGMSYMGNTSQAVVDFIFSNFKLLISVTFVKLFFVYIFVLVLWMAIADYFSGFVSSVLKKDFSPAVDSAISFIYGLFLYLLVLTEHMIRYPQVYINSFYNKNSVNASIMEWCTRALDPNILRAAVLVLITISVFSFFYNIRSKYGTAVLLKTTFSLLAVAVFIFMMNVTGKPAKNKDPNILILASDALRPDHFSGYGYPRKTTPNIDALIKESTSFTSCFTEVPRTFPSWINILSGQFASTHGVRHMFPSSMEINTDIETFVKVLRNRGYSTAAVGDYAADIFNRFDYGFSETEAPKFNFNEIIVQGILDSHTFLQPFLYSRPGTFLFRELKGTASFCPPDLLKESIISRLEKIKKGPFCLVSFFSSTHFPYASPYPYYKKFSAKGYNGPYRYMKQQVLSIGGQKTDTITPADIEQVKALYDGSLNAFDKAVGDIISYLKKNGLYDNTIIVVLSDHGENLYEEYYGMGHGEHFNGNYAIRTPLIIRYPEKIPRDRKENFIVRNVDIAPTLLDLAGAEKLKHCEGESVLKYIGGKREAYAYGETGIWFDNSMREELFFQKQRIMYPDITGLSAVDFDFDTQIVLDHKYTDLINTAKHRYVLDGRYKLIYMPKKEGVFFSMYDLAVDPAEKNNIASPGNTDSIRLKDALYKWAQRNGDTVIIHDYILPAFRY